MSVDFCDDFCVERNEMVMNERDKQRLTQKLHESEYNNPR